MQPVAEENLLFIDIETVSCFARYEQMPEEWKKLWEEKIARTIPEGLSPAAYYPQRAGILAEFAKVVCISFGYFKPVDAARQLRLRSIYSTNETEVLQTFIDTVCQLHTKNNWCFAGHNIREFDIPFLCRRILINKLSIPECFNFQGMKPWEVHILDTLQLWRFGDHKNYTSLKLLAAALGIPSPKEDMDGSMVGKVYWEEMDLAKIAAYCRRDVATVANVVLCYRQLPQLTGEQIVVI